MKILSFTVLNLIVVSSVVAEPATVYNPEDGSIRHYDVQKRDDNSFTVYDVERGSIMDGRMEGNSGHLFDIESGNIVHIQKTGPNSYNTFDLQTGKHSSIQTFGTFEE